MSAEGDTGPGFLGRWSARKRGSAAPDDDAVATGPGEAGVVPGTGPRTDSPVAPDAAEASPAPASGPDAHGAPDAAAGTPSGAAAIDTDEPPPLTDADMPPLDSLDAGSDLSAFFSRGVSATLRRAALRHVFHQPAYNVRDGLNDYDGDFTVFEPLGDTVTADMKFHAARHERDRLERERLEVERLEAERLEAERLEAERAGDERGGEDDVEPMAEADAAAEDAGDADEADRAAAGEGGDTSEKSVASSEVSERVDSERDHADG